MTTSEAVFDAAHRMQSDGIPYALVSVVRALAPASARPGDKAVVTQDGRVHGWIGGGCAQPVVIRTVMQVLNDGKARLIRISPAATGSEKDSGDMLEFAMSCHSGGTLELFVDPVLPPARLVIVGSSPVAISLAQLASRVGFSVTAVAHEADPSAHADAIRVISTDLLSDVAPLVAPGAWVVVATQGRRDIQALRLALGLSPRYLAFVASARKAQVLKDSLIAAGADAMAVQSIVAPAGLPMPATTPEEIALSVLAALVSNRRADAEELPPSASEESLAPARPEPSQQPRASGLRTGTSCCHATSSPEPALAEAPSSCCGS